MSVTEADGGRTRRQAESLAARQARVGIVANPLKPPSRVPAPREVWVRWPDLRSARRCKDKDHLSPLPQDDLARMDAFVRSVRRSGPAPDLSVAEEETAPGRSWRWVVLAGVIGIVALAFLLVAMGIAAAAYL
jgi:hypothetical protein